MKYTLSALLSFCCLLMLTQHSMSQVLDMNWQTDPKPHTISNPQFLKESAVIISEHTQLILGNNLSGNLMFTRKLHKIVRVNDEKGIEMYNKIKVSYDADYPVTMVKARSISPAGKVIELKSTDFKDIKNEEGGMQKIFALEGVEKGSEVEYIIYQQQRFMPFGAEYMQDVMPTVESVFELVSPKNFIFEIKGYNQAKTDADTLLNDRNCYVARTANLPGLEEEKYASYVSHFSRIEYTLAYNTENKTKNERLYNWDVIMKGLYKSYTTFTEKEIKAALKLLESNKAYNALTATSDKIAFIEDYVKTNYIQQDYVADEHAEETEFILKNKVTNESGMKQFFALMFTAYKIPFEIGYTTDRFRKRFDYAFMNADNLNYCIFYFPETKQYLAPNEMFYRSPYIPSLWCDQSGVFTRVFRLGDVLSVRAEERQIPISPVNDNFHNHIAEVHFNNDMDTCTIQMSQVFGGQKAAEIMPLLVLLESDKRDEQVKEFFKLGEKDEKIEGLTYENNQFSSLAKKLPLKVSAKIEATNSIEKAGNKYIYKIGELIGRQAEMYQEKERQFDLEIPEPHQYTRKLTVHIPAGYTVSGLDKLNMNVVANEGNKESCKFVSSYELKGDVLEVSVFEIYHDTFTSKSIYEPYRKVINAAADFNKIVVMLEKKK